MASTLPVDAVLEVAGTDAGVGAVLVAPVVVAAARRFSRRGRGNRCHPDDGRAAAALAARRREQWLHATTFCFHVWGMFSQTLDVATDVAVLHAVRGARPAAGAGRTPWPVERFCRILFRIERRCIAHSYGPVPSFLLRALCGFLTGTNTSCSGASSCRTP